MSDLQNTRILLNCNALIVGTRMWRRGANLEGATANFVETEQLVEYEGLTSSFIQVLHDIINEISWCSG